MSQEMLFPDPNTDGSPPEKPVEPERLPAIYGEPPAPEEVAAPEVETPTETAAEEPIDREDIPDYDPVAYASELNQFGDQAAVVHARARMQAIEQELAQLPATMPSEDDLLKMPERQRMALMRAFARREYLEGVRDQVIPNEYRQIQQINRIKAEKVQKNTDDVFRKYPERAHLILEAVRQMNDTNKIGIDELANPSFYDMVDTMVVGQQLKDKGSRQQLRKVAQATQTAGRGSTAPDRGAIGGDEVANFGKTPSQVATQLEIMGFSKDLIPQMLGRIFQK